MCTCVCVGGGEGEFGIGIWKDAKCVVDRFE